MPERLFDDDPEPTDQDQHLTRPCIYCRAPLSFNGQPGEATRAVCGVRQYLTEPSKLYPDGGQGRWS